MELTNEEKTIIVQALNEISVPVKQVNTVLTIINKLTLQLNAKTEEVKKEGE